MKMVHNMLSKNDAETLRILDDVILLAVHANPDGLEMISDWYMRNKNEKDRTTRNLPRLYQRVPQQFLILCLKAGRTPLMMSLENPSTLPMIGDP